MIWNVWQVFRKYPYLIPVLVIILILAAFGHLLAFFKTRLQKSNCPGCRKDKAVCIVACERISRRLNEIDSEVASEPVS